MVEHGAVNAPVRVSERLSYTVRGVGGVVCEVCVGVWRLVGLEPDNRPAVFGRGNDLAGRRVGHVLLTGNLLHDHFLHHYGLAGDFDGLDDLFLDHDGLAGHLNGLDDLFDDGLPGDLDSLDDLFLHHDGLAGDHHLLDDLFGDGLTWDLDGLDNLFLDHDGLAGHLNGLSYNFLDHDGLAGDLDGLRATGRSDHQQHCRRYGDH